MRIPEALKTNRISKHKISEIAEAWIEGKADFPNMVSSSILHQIADELCKSHDIARVREFVNEAANHSSAQSFSVLRSIISHVDPLYYTRGAPPRFDRSRDFQLLKTHRSARNLLVVFLGNSMRLFAPMELVQVLLAFHEWDILYIGDRTRTAYLNGNETYPSQQSLIEAIQKVANQGQHDRIVTLGSSAGTFAALQYAVPLRATHVIGLAGPTFFSRQTENPAVQMLNKRMTAQPASFKNAELDALTDDLRSLSPQIRYYYGDGCKKDVVAARHLDKSGLGKSFPLVKHDNHNVMDAILDLGVFQADLAAASEDEAFLFADEFKARANVGK